ncbi:MAG: FecR domain-containing protein [Ginsengibacter sp.]
MSKPEEQISILLKALHSKTATPVQEQELTDWLLEAEKDEVLKEYMQNIWEEFLPEKHTNKVDWENMYQNILEKETEAKQVSMRFSLKRMAAAAVILLFLSVGTYYVLKSDTNLQIAKSETQSGMKEDLAAPVANKAILTLSDGTVILLEEEENGALAVQGNVRVEKTADGQIVYSGSSTELQMNTISVPKGSKPLQLKLADGSIVWLNVGSVFTYPASFAGKTRQVEISGEAYFEIARDLSKPFIVINGNAKINVLGTHFNVQAYDNEAARRVTLLEGSVRVQEGNASDLLKPGQQAVLDVKKSGSIQVVNAEVEKVMAWKNGIFNFDGASLDEVMRQLERWYNIEVVYEKGIPDIEFVGKMSKNIHLDDLLEILKKTKVHFKLVEGRKLIVSDK